MPHTVHSLIMRICPVGQSIHLILFSPLFNDHLVTMEMVIQVHPNCSNYVFTTRGRSRGGALVPALVSGQTKLDGLRKVISEVWPHYYLKVWKSEPPHLLEDLNLPLTTAIKNKGFTQCLLIIFLFWTFTICFIDLFHFHSLPKNWYHIPTPSHNCQVPAKATYLCLQGGNYREVWLCKGQCHRQPKFTQRGRVYKIFILTGTVWIKLTFDETLFHSKVMLHLMCVRIKKSHTLNTF